MAKQQTDKATLKALCVEYRRDEAWAAAYNQYRKEQKFLTEKIMAGGCLMYDV